MNGPVPAPSPSQPRLGQFLLRQGVVSEDQLRIALQEQAKTRQALGKLLVSLGFVTEAILSDALGVCLGTPRVDLAKATVDAAALKLVPRELAQRHRLLPLNYDVAARRLTVAVADAADLLAQDQLRNLAQGGLEIETLIAGESEIERALDQHYGHTLSIDGILHEIETGEIDTADSLAYAQPIVRLVDALLTDAVKREASDLHFEPEAGFLRIRYRIDGILRQIRALHASCWPAMAVRLKVMAGMNIAETRAPQDGRFSLHVGGRPVDFRASAQPTLHGENLVLRILDRQKGLLPLAALGLEPAQLALIEAMMARPEGLILVTGPTGSGKTTTLYSMLGRINCEAVNIMTLEDPVEYPLPLLRQTSVADAARLGFADGIRSMMRQDPDVILVGEIRDRDTAEMAFRAAMTGHQVYSTLHSNSALGALPRLADIGVSPEILAGNLIGVIAQRLVRKLCPHCRVAKPADQRQRRLLAVSENEAVPTLYQPSGCPLCEFQGYKGRLAILEVLRLDNDLDELIARRATPSEMRQAAHERGWRPLVEDGRKRVLQGVTSLDELARVVDLSQGLV